MALYAAAWHLNMFSSFCPAALNWNKCPGGWLPSTCPHSEAASGSLKVAHRRTRCPANGSRVMFCRFCVRHLDKVPENFHHKATCSLLWTTSTGLVIWQCLILTQLLPTCVANGTTRALPKKQAKLTKVPKGYLSPLYKQRDAVFCGEFT